MNRFRNTLYTIETVVFRDHRHQYIQNEDGTLFSGQYKTKILPQDLPEWYVYGRFYKRFGYLSTKGITDLLYVPSRFSNHYLKDDALYIAYGGKIQQTVPTGHQSIHECISGFDERVWGNEILDVLKGARIYSDYDISDIVQQLKEKKEWLISKYPEEFGPERWNFDVDAFFSRPFSNGHPEKYYAITLNNYFSPSFVSGVKRYYGTLDQIKSFLGTLEYEDYKSTIEAFHAYLKGNTEATHFADYVERKLIEPVTFIKHSFVHEISKEWDFKNVWGCTYKMRCDSVHTNVILLKDGEQYVRCINPVLEKPCFFSEVPSENEWQPIDTLCGHPGILSFDKEHEGTIQSSLYLPERKFSDVKEAVAELGSDDIDLSIVCEDIFADG